MKFEFFRRISSRREKLAAEGGRACPGNRTCLSWLVLACPNKRRRHWHATAGTCPGLPLHRGGAPKATRGGAPGKKCRGAAAGCVGDFPRRKALAPFGYASQRRVEKRVQQPCPQAELQVYTAATPKAHCTETSLRLSRLVLLY